MGSSLITLFVQEAQIIVSSPSLLTITATLQTL